MRRFGKFADTYLGLEDAAEEMKRMEAVEKARIELNGGERKSR